MRILFTLARPCDNYGHTGQLLIVIGGAVLTIMFFRASILTLNAALVK